MHIGLLEDNLAILELIQTTLEMVGHSVSTYTHGQSLLNTLFEGDSVTLTLPTSLPYDLLIVDLNLPGKLSGLDVIASIYRLLGPDVLPIIVVSAAGADQLDELHRRFPRLPVVRKPFAIRTLLQTISSSSGSDVLKRLDGE